MSHPARFSRVSSTLQSLATRHLALATALVFSLATSHLPLATAQENSARISGIITDQQKAVLRNAKIDLINLDTGVHYPTVSNNDGVYVVSAPVGDYRLQVDHVGFKTVIAANIVLHTQDAREINFEMSIGSASETVTVNGSSTNDSPAVSMTVTREFIENMPLNGQSLQDLVQLAPGTVSSQGYYSVDGQRTDSNNYTVDGVSANLGGYFNFAGISVGAGLSGSAPSQTVLGTTQSLASIDSLQEFTIQTSGYSAEYGRNPGGQVQFTTRSGTNDIHGSVFEYLRNTAFDANSYYNDYYNQPQTAEHQNDFGGTIGGPVLIPRLYNGKDKTFYFFSYEGLRLLLPSTESEYVPTAAFRASASPNIQPFLNAEPLPNRGSPGNQDGCTIPDPTTGQPTACDALFYYGYSYPNNLDNISVRVDQTFGRRLHAFVRYADTPSSSAVGVEQVSTSAINAHSWTAGLTANITNSLLDDLRFNYSHDGEEGIATQRAINGSVPFRRSMLIPAIYDSSFANGTFYAYVPNSALFFGIATSGTGQGTLQHQYQCVDSIQWTKNQHSIKFGGDWRRLTPTYAPPPYASIVQAGTLSDIQQGFATSVQISAAAAGQPVFDNLSLYFEDHWKVSPRLTIDYGLRWEFNPPPGPSNGHYPVTLSSTDLATAQLSPVGTQPYKTIYNHFAPRFGFAWNAVPSQKHPLTVRGGFGIFFDTGQSVIGNAYAGAYPFGAQGPTQTEVQLPLTDSELAPPPLNIPLTPPYPELAGLAIPNLTAPYTEQWNLSLDEALNANNVLTVSYVGNGGRKLLFTEDYSSAPLGNQLFPDGLQFTSNASKSGYNALQVQDTGRVLKGLDIVGSFTWAHSLDNASNDSSGYPPLWGNSDNDLRRVLNLALNYQTATAGSRRWPSLVTNGWLLANRFSTQSGYPINIAQTCAVLPNGVYTCYAPDLVSGVPIYLHGRAADMNGQSVPANWRLNSAAFALVSTDPSTGIPVREGTLGRNYVRQPSFYALNTAIQRSFPIYEQLHLNFRVDAFNILNHPSLNDPDGTLSDSTFGQLIGGHTTTIGASNALYAMGASRSLQFSLKLQF